MDDLDLDRMQFHDRRLELIRKEIDKLCAHHGPLDVNSLSVDAPAIVAVLGDGSASDAFGALLDLWVNPGSRELDAVLAHIGFRESYEEPETSVEDRFADVAKNWPLPSGELASKRTLYNWSEKGKEALVNWILRDRHPGHVPTSNVRIGPIREGEVGLSAVFGIPEPLPLVVPIFSVATPDWFYHFSFQDSNFEKIGREYRMKKPIVFPNVVFPVVVLMRWLQAVQPYFGFTFEPFGPEYVHETNVIHRGALAGVCLPSQHEALRELAEALAIPPERHQVAILDLGD